MNILTNLYAVKDILWRTNNRELQNWTHDAMEVMTSALQNEGKIMACGCGGSYCDAEHFCEELTGRLRGDHNRPPIPAIHLGGGGHVTCVANDYGFEQVYSRLVDAHGRPGDVLVALSTSGKSWSVINAIDEAWSRSMHCVIITGEKGFLQAPADKQHLIYRVPSTDAARIQEFTKFLLHSLAEGIEDDLY